jgi:CO/xanthine dehydrogenase Mo-binding subunit
MSGRAPLPAILEQNPRLDQWVGFPAPGRVRVSTGRVEIGQGVLTAMLQIAADELDVSPERIDLLTGDTEATPNEGYTAGSQSIQFGGVALRLACAEVRELFLDHVAVTAGSRERADLSVHDGAIFVGGKPTGLDYWSLAPAVDLSRRVIGDAPLKTDFAVVGRNAPRIDLAAKVFGGAAFVHDMKADGMVHARVVRQPQRGASIASIDEAAIHRAAKGKIEFLREGNFLAIIGDDETVVEAAAAVAPGHVAWMGLEPLNPAQEEGRWLLQRPTIDQSLGAPPPTEPAPASQRYEATFTRMHVAHASIGPSCGLAVYRDGKLQVWTHSQGVYPLRAALAQMLELDPAAISVKHVQGPGCYGHNGADDAAADAAVIALRTPGKPIKVRWRREEEFGFEPVSPAMVVSISATLDKDGRPSDWTTEIWSGRHGSRPGAGARQAPDGHWLEASNLLTAEALPNPPPARPAAESSAAPGAGTRNGEPLYAFPAKRISHHLVAETPVRTSSLRGLGATANVFAIESAIDELAERAGEDPVAYRLSILTDPRARAVVEKVAAMADWPNGPSGTGQGRGIGFARYKNMAAYAAIVADVEVDEAVRLTRVWCAADAGLVINPDGAINQLEGGIIQGASWALKEGVRLDSAGISSRDWETYPVLRFSEVPEVTVKLVNPTTDLPPLGVGEATGGPTVAAIGNAVAKALGARLRDLPLTRERVMAALLQA